MTPAVVAQTTPRDAIRAAWTRYTIVSTGLVLLVVTILFAIWPWPYALVVQRVLLPGHEQEFGFHGGMIRPPDSEYSVYGIASVVPGGRLDRAGVKAGDIPVEHHGGMWSFYYALEEAAEGREGRFKVVSDLRDWYQDRERARVIKLFPKGEAQ